MRLYKHCKIAIPNHKISFVRRLVQICPDLEVKCVLIVFPKTCLQFHTLIIQCNIALRIKVNLVLFMQ